MTNNAAKKTNPPFTPAQASLMAERLRSRGPRDHGPLSSPGVEKLLPGDDLSMFFKNRDVPDSGRGGFGYFFMRALVVLLIVGTFIVVYNKEPKVRVFTSTQSKRWLGVDLGKFVPKVTFSKTPSQKVGPHSKQSQVAAPTGKQIVVLDTRVMMVRSGLWTEVDARLQGRCLAWIASPDCAVKGFYLASKGLVKVAAPMNKISDAEVAKLKPGDKVLWYLSQSLILGSTDKDHKKFRAALAAIPFSSPETKRLVFDEVIVASAIGRRVNDIAFYLNLASNEKMTPSWASSMSKWRALDSVVRKKSLSSELATDVLKIGKGTLRLDPRALEILVPAIIRVGKAEKLSPFTAEAALEALKSKMDPSLARRALATHTRVLWANGRRAETGRILSNYVNRLGRDNFSNHFQAAMIFQNGSKEQAIKSLKLLSQVNSASPWETIYLKGFALIRSGQPAGALPLIQAVAATSQEPSQKMWASLLRAEYFISQRKFDRALATANPFLGSPVVPLLVYEILQRSYRGLGKDRDAGSVGLKIDDVKAKTGYSSSLEMLGSPLGPLALIR